MVGAVTTMRPTMHRRLIALAAAYAIALQAVVASFAALAAAGAVVPGLCTSSAPQERPGRDSEHAVACVACSACCSAGGLSGMPPASIELPALRATADRGAHARPRVMVRATPRNLPPSRAPPVV
jgi:hypothetical protein